MFAYLERLLQRSVFKSVEVRFVMVGHTDQKLGQAFSKMFNGLRLQKYY